MTVVATGPLMAPMQGLAKLLAACGTFAGLCQAAGVSDPLSRIEYPEAGDADIQLPRAIIRNAPGFASQRQGAGTWNYGGNLELSFEFAPHDANASEADQLGVFLNQLGAILLEMQALEGQGDAGDGCSYLHTINVTDAGIPPGKCNPQEQGGEAYFAAVWAVQWSG